VVLAVHHDSMAFLGQRELLAVAEWPGKDLVLTYPTRVRAGDGVGKTHGVLSSVGQDEWARVDAVCVVVHVVDLVRKQRHTASVE
jgi:hypothetical protein